MISSTACGTVTLKSLLSLGSDAPHVHLRLRKRLSRCTLDCGFKTPESPALRGFVVERCPITGTSLYLDLVLKSNGLRHSKNLPVKFDFSPIDTSATIAKKLPPQRCSKPIFSAFFNFSHNRPTFAFTSESGHTLGSRRKIAHNGSHGETRGRFGWGRYYYPRTVPHVSETLRGQGVERHTLPLLGLGWGVLPKNAESLGTAMRSCVSLFRGVAAPLGYVICLQLGDVAVFSLCAQYFLIVRGGGGITTLSALCVLLKRRTAACQKGSFAVF